MKTYAELLAESKARIRETPLDEARALHDAKADVVFLDVREPNEYNLGRIPGAVFIPRGRLESDVEARISRDVVARAVPEVTRIVARLLAGKSEEPETNPTRDIDEA